MTTWRLLQSYRHVAENDSHPDDGSSALRPKHWQISATLRGVTSLEGSFTNSAVRNSKYRQIQYFNVQCRPVSPAINDFYSSSFTLNFTYIFYLPFIFFLPLSLTYFTRLLPNNHLSFSSTSRHPFLHPQNFFMISALVSALAAQRRKYSRSLTGVPVQLPATHMKLTKIFSEILKVMKE